MKITFQHVVDQDEHLKPDELITLLLKSRKVENVKDFLTPPQPMTIKLSDFGKTYAKSMKKVIALLKQIKKQGRTIVVYTDYDADGVTGGTVLWETLHLLGFKTMPYVPDRKKEGYGFSIIGIDAVKKKYDPALIISVDHGITAKDKVTYAKKLGIPIVITDHHLKPEKLPTDALAIFHIPALSGSGVAYVIAKEIYEHFGKNNTKLQHNFHHEYPALAAIGTIADLVPLVGPSRSIVYHGLEACAKTTRHGLIHIMRQAGIEGRKITPFEVGFIIAPRINAVGRLGSAINALQLLCTTDNLRAQTLAQSIGNTNRERQDMVKVAVEEAKDLVSKMKKLPKLIILTSDKWHEGIIGLIASKIAEEYYRPTIIMTKSDGFSKGSARSIPSFHLTNFLRSLKKHLVDVGGHAAAAGFTIEQKKLSAFIKAAERKADILLKTKDLEKKLEADFSMPLSLVTMRLAQELEKLQPFGTGNPQPVFYSEAELIDAKIFGKKNEHLKFYVKDPRKNSFPLEIVAFGQAELFQSLSNGMKMKIAYSLMIDRWGGNERLRGKLIYMQK